MKALFQSVKNAMGWSGRTWFYMKSLDTDVLYKAVDYISRADVLIVGGHPGCLSCRRPCGLLQGDKLVLINKQQLYDSRANIVIHDSIGKVLSSVIS